VLGGLVAIDHCAQDFGTVYPPAPVTRPFRLTNTSRRTLVAQKVTASPDASARLLKRRLAPGETTILHLTGKTQGKKGTARFGTSIAFQGVENPLVFQMRGTVAETFPTRIEVGDILRGRVPAITYDVRPERTAKLHVKRIACDEKFLRVRVSQQKVGLRVQVAFSPQIPYGDFAQTVTLETNDPITPQKKTNLIGHVLEPIVCQPDYISLDVLPSPDQVRGVIRLVSPYGQPFTLRRVVSDVPGLRLQPASQHKAVTHVLYLAATDALPSDSIEGTVTVETSLPDDELRLPVYGLRMAQAEQRL
jgi:hypothetical protein